MASFLRRPAVESGVATREKPEAAVSQVFRPQLVRTPEFTCRMDGRATLSASDLGLEEA